MDGRLRDPGGALSACSHHYVPADPAQVQGTRDGLGLQIEPEALRLEGDRGVSPALEYILTNVSLDRQPVGLRERHLLTWRVCRDADHPQRVRLKDAADSASIGREAQDKVDGGELEVVPQGLKDTLPPCAHTAGSDVRADANQGSALDGASGQATDEVLLQREEQGHDRDGHQHRRGGKAPPLDALLPDVPLDGDRQRER